jgi:hypothetical protein
VSILGGAIDERFLRHRLKSTSIAGITSALSALGLFAWRYYVDHVWSWDLFAVAGAFLVVKLGAMAWYRMTD